MRRSVARRPGGAMAGTAAGGLAVDEAEVRARLEAARAEHRELDRAIDAFAGQWPPDQVQVARWKKRKLLLKDEITALEDQLIPDIIA